MKKLILLLVLALTLTYCNKDDNPPADPLSQLPPATQTGAGTFGCLINGVPYVDNSGDFNCFYQLVNGEYYFGIQASDNVGNIATIALGSLMKEIQTNINYPLNLRENNEFYALLDFNTLVQEGSTSNSDDGFIKFTKFSTNPNIVAANFEFSITDPNTGIVYNITNGRFDSQFTQ